MIFSKKQTTIAIALTAVFAMTSAASAQSPIDSKRQVASAQFANHKAEKSPAQSSLITLGTNDNIFEITRNAPGVVLVDFYADWCGPCRKQGGILRDMVSTARQRRATIIKVNVDDHPELASDLQISSLPTLLLVKDGRVVSRESGIADRERVAALLNQ